MGIYKIHGQLYRGEYPVKVVVEGDEITSDDDGVIVDPPEHIARLLEGMPEWIRVQGSSPFGPKNVNDDVADTIGTRG